MLSIQSGQPLHALRPFVRAYAQRVTRILAAPVNEAVPARLETVLEFEFGDDFFVNFEDGTNVSSPRIVVIGPQTHCRAQIQLLGNIESFAIFFQPAGFLRLFGVPVSTLKNSAVEGSSTGLPNVRHLWNQLSSATRFSDRASIVNQYLLTLAAKSSQTSDVIAFAMDLILRRGGATTLDALTADLNISRRHFQRLFASQVGMTPKSYARIARFQTALDTKIAQPGRTWMDIAHSLQYSDQMHMVHDFKRLAGASPGHLLQILGDMRPQALASQNTCKVEFQELWQADASLSRLEKKLAKLAASD